MSITYSYLNIRPVFIHRTIFENDKSTSDDASANAKEFKRRIWRDEFVLTTTVTI